MNSYLLESTDPLSLQREREKILKENKFQDAIINIYDLEETTLDKALEDLDTYSFLSDKKVIVIKKIENGKVDDFKEDFDHLYRYIENPNPSNLLIIEATKLNNTLKITKELKKRCKYEEVNLNGKDTIQKSFQGFQIDSSAIHLLEEYSLGDYSKIVNECEKLKNYKWEEKKITKKDIEELVVKKLGDAKDLTFAFSKALMMRDKKDSLMKYQELLSYDIEPLSIIGLLASQMRILYQVKLLDKKRLTNKEIAEILEEKSDYRIQKTREVIRYYSEEDILHMMQSLQTIDYRMKTEDVDGNHLIEMFLLNI